MFFFFFLINNVCSLCSFYWLLDSAGLLFIKEGFVVLFSYQRRSVRFVVVIAVLEPRFGRTIFLTKGLLVLVIVVLCFVDFFTKQGSVVIHTGQCLFVLAVFLLKVGLLILWPLVIWSSVLLPNEVRSLMPLLHCTLTIWSN